MTAAANPSPVEAGLADPGWGSKQTEAANQRKAVTTMAEATTKDVKNFFGMSLQEMKDEWLTLPQKDREDILKGLGDGTLNY